MLNLSLFLCIKYIFMLHCNEVQSVQLVGMFILPKLKVSNISKIFYINWCSSVPNNPLRIKIYQENIRASPLKMFYKQEWVTDSCRWMKCTKLFIKPRTGFWGKMKSKIWWWMKCTKLVDILRNLDMKPALVSLVWLFWSCLFGWLFGMYNS